jgi:hypothetical protein
MASSIKWLLTSFTIVVVDKLERNRFLGRVHRIQLPGRVDRNDELTNLKSSASGLAGSIDLKKFSLKSRSSTPFGISTEQVVWFETVPDIGSNTGFAFVASDITS